MGQRKKIEYSFLDKPLDGAVRWARHLFNNSLEDVETYSLIAAIYRRKQKYFLAYQYIQQGIKIDSKNVCLLKEKQKLTFIISKLNSFVKKHVLLYKMQCNSTLNRLSSLSQQQKDSIRYFENIFIQKKDVNQFLKKIKKNIKYSTFHELFKLYHRLKLYGGFTTKLRSLILKFFPLSDQLIIPSMQKT